MRPLDADTITQAVIARHAAVGDARLREVATSLVQHLHAFARETRLTEGEWRAGLRFLADCARATALPERNEFALLSDALGLSALVAAQGQRRDSPATAPTLAEPCAAGSERVRVRGVVRSGADGRTLAGATLRHADGCTQADADGCFALTTRAAGGAVAPDGPVLALLAALGRAPRRPAHVRLKIDAPGHRPLVTQLFREGDADLDADAAFGVRASLVTRWSPVHDGDAGCALDFDFILDPAPQGDPT